MAALHIGKSTEQIAGMFEFTPFGLEQKTRNFYQATVKIYFPQVFSALNYSCLFDIYPLKGNRFLYVPPGLTFKNSTRCPLCAECFVWISEHTATFAVYVIH